MYSVGRYHYLNIDLSGISLAYSFINTLIVCCAMPIHYEALKLSL